MNSTSSDHFILGSNEEGTDDTDEVEVGSDKMTEMESTQLATDILT